MVRFDSPDSGPQVCFFFSGRSGGTDGVEARTNLLHDDEELIPWFEKHDIALSHQSHLPLQMIAAGGDTIEIGEPESFFAGDYAPDRPVIEPGDPRPITGMGVQIRFQTQIN